MKIVDAQVHVWDSNRPDHPSSFTDDTMMIAAMDEVGVEAAVVVPNAGYGSDNSYVLEAAARHPDRFKVVGRIDPWADDVTDRMAEFASHPAAVGVRLVIKTDEQVAALREGGLDAYLNGAYEHDLAVCVYSPGQVAAVAILAESYPTVQFVLDHLGLPVPSAVPGGNPLDVMPAVLRLAPFGNVNLKVTGVPSLSSEAFPFSDLRPHLRSVFETFGFERLMWGTDWTRVKNATYSEGVRYITEWDELNADEKHQLMELTLRRIFRWSA